MNLIAATTSRRSSSASAIPRAMKRIVKEPLLHFLLLGAAIFAVYTLIYRGIGGEPGKIVVTQGQLASIKADFFLTRHRAPTEEELEGLIRERVREEVYSRGARAGAGQG